MEWLTRKYLASACYAPKGALELSQGFNRGKFLPRRGYRTQPRVSTLGTLK